MLLSHTARKRSSVNERIGEPPTDHMIHTPLDHMTQRQRLILPSHHEHNLPRVHDGLDADGERHTGDEGEVVVEESAVVEDGLVR